MRQETLTVVAAVRNLPRAHAVLRELLEDSVGVGVSAQPSVFAGLGIHFARLVILEEPVTSPFPSTLVLESNFDTEEAHGGPARDAHLERLSNARGPQLFALFACCEGFDPSFRSDTFARALKRRLVRASAAYQGHTQRDLPRITLENEVRAEVMRCAASLPAGIAGGELYRSVRAHVQSVARREPARFVGLDLEASAPSDPDPATRDEKLAQKVRPWLVNGWAALPLVPVMPLVAYHQDRELCFDLQREAESLGPDGLRLLRANAESEDHAAQNALTHVVPLRGGFWRRWTVRNAHAYLNQLARRHFNFVEQLGGIPTIHFAKWMLIDNGRRMLFFSNFDGSWESYLGDFVDRAAIGLNLAWSCTEHYPRTRWLLHGGANDEERFKAWGRAHQRPTQLFYRAYPTLSVADVNNNSWLRWGLHKGGPGDLAQWLRRLT